MGELAKWEFKTDFGQQLEKVKNKTQNLILRKALSKAAAPVKAAVVQAAPVRYGYLGKSIRIRVVSYQNKTIFVALVGPKRDFVRSKGVITRGPKKGEKRRFRPSFIAHIVERGSKHAKAEPFLKPALDGTRSQFENTFSLSVKEQVEAILSKN